MLCAAFVQGFHAPVSSKVVQSRGSVAMSEPAFDRRSLLQTVAGAAVAGLPLAAQADGANNPTNAARAKQIYGARIFKLQSGTAEDILAEKNAFQVPCPRPARGVPLPPPQPACRRFSAASRDRLVTVSPPGRACSW